MPFTLGGGRSDLKPNHVCIFRVKGKGGDSGIMVTATVKSLSRSFDLSPSLSLVFYTTNSGGVGCTRLSSSFTDVGVKVECLPDT